MPLTVTAIAGLGTAAYKLYQANKQAKLAAQLRQTDTTPEGQKQNLVAAQLAASANRLPGEDVAENQINQGTSATLNAARQGATSGSSLLASLGRANGQRLAALSGLNTRVLQYGDAARARLASANATQAGYDDRSRSEYVNAKTSLDQASAENTAGAISDAANVAAFYYTNKKADDLASNNPAAAAAAAAASAAPAPSAYNLPGQNFVQRLATQRRMRTAYRNAPISQGNY